MNCLEVERFEKVSYVYFRMNYCFIMSTETKKCCFTIIV